MLSLHASTQPLVDLTSSAPSAVVLLSGPEGGLSDAEDAAARQAGYVAVHVGERILRAETAALAALAFLSLHG